MALDDEGRLRAVASSVTEQAGYDLEELTIVAAGRRSVVRVVIDTDGGISLDAAADISRQISARLDEEGADSGLAAYTLEVTSPGISRPLTEPRHFRRAIGRLVTLSLADGSVVEGRVRAVTGGQLGLLVGSAGLDEKSVALSQVSRGRVEVEFNPPPAAVSKLLAGDAAERARTADKSAAIDPPAPASDDPNTDRHPAGPSSERG